MTHSAPANSDSPPQPIAAPPLSRGNATARWSCRFSRTGAHSLPMCRLNSVCFACYEIEIFASNCNERRLRVSCKKVSPAKSNEESRRQRKNCSARATSQHNFKFHRVAHALSRVSRTPPLLLFVCAATLQKYVGCHHGACGKNKINLRALGLEPRTFRV